MGEGRCPRCSGPGPTRWVHLHRHIGLLVIFVHTRIRGEMCRSCLEKAFQDAFLVTLFAGWWGIVSFFATLFFLPYDLVHYLLTRASYGSAETASASTTRTALSVMAGALPLLGVMCGGPYLLIGALAAFVGSASGPYDESTVATSPVAHVCSGEPSPSAPSYDDASALELLAFSETTDGWVSDSRFAPEAVRTDALEPAVVLCVDRERTEVVEECAGGDARRIAYPRDVRLVEARTGVELTRTTVMGSDPPGPCPPPTSAGSATSDRPITLSGARVQPSDVAAAVALLAAAGIPSSASR